MPSAKDVQKNPEYRRRISELLALTDENGKPRFSPYGAHLVASFELGGYEPLNEADRKIVDQYVNAARQFEAAPRLKAERLAEQGLFEPIQRQFGLARQQLGQQALRTGQPIGALYTSLAGQESEALADTAQRRFSNVQGLRGFEEQRRQFGQSLSEQQRQFNKEHEGGGFGGFLKDVAGLAGSAFGLFGGGKKKQSTRSISPPPSTNTNYGSYGDEGFSY